MRFFDLTLASFCAVFISLLLFLSSPSLSLSLFSKEGNNFIFRITIHYDYVYYPSFLSRAVQEFLFQLLPLRSCKDAIPSVAINERHKAGNTVIAECNTSFHGHLDFIFDIKFNVFLQKRGRAEKKLDTCRLTSLIRDSNCLQDGATRFSKFRIW